MIPILQMRKLRFDISMFGASWPMATLAFGASQAFLYML